MSENETIAGQNIGDFSGDLTSRFEIAVRDIISEFQNISIDNGYRNDVNDVLNAVRPFEAINNTEIGIVMPTWKLLGIDSTWGTYDTICDVVVQGVVTSNTSNSKDSSILNTKINSLAHDMTRVMSIIMTKYINVQFRWNILPKPITFASGIDFGQQENQGVVFIGFQIQLRSMDGTFL